MRKAEMVQRIAQELACTTAQAAAAVEAILTEVVQPISPQHLDT